MSESSLQRSLVFFFRITMGWTFLYAGVSQLMRPDWSAAKFLAGTKTFHAVFAPLSTSAAMPYIDFLVQWGHTLIGLSLIFGLLVRVSAPFGVLLMVFYYFAHMDFPYIEARTNFIVDFHMVYAGVLIYLIAARAGHVFGLDGWAARLPAVSGNPRLRSLVA